MIEKLIGKRSDGLRSRWIIAVISFALTITVVADSVAASYRAVLIPPSNSPVVMEGVAFSGKQTSDIRANFRSHFSQVDASKVYVTRIHVPSQAVRDLGAIEFLMGDFQKWIDDAVHGLFKGVISRIADFISVEGSRIIGGTRGANIALNLVDKKGHVYNLKNAAIDAAKMNKMGLATTAAECVSMLIGDATLARIKDLEQEGMMFHHYPGQNGFRDMEIMFFNIEDSEHLVLDQNTGRRLPTGTRIFAHYYFYRYPGSDNEWKYYTGFCTLITQ